MPAEPTLTQLDSKLLPTSHLPGAVLDVQGALPCVIRSSPHRFRRLAAAAGQTFDAREELIDSFESAYGCPFCDVVEDGTSPVWRYLFPNDDSSDLLAEETQVCAVLDTAPIAEGHVLLITREHIPSMARLEPAAQKEMLGLRSRVHEVLTTEFGPVVMFEHGALTATHAAGGCVDHAHLHLLPSVVSLTPRIRADYPDLRSFGQYADALVALRGQPYLYWEDSMTGAHAVSAPACSTQYLRRLLAESELKADRWNWRDCIRRAESMNLREQLARAHRTLSLGLTRPD